MDIFIVSLSPFVNPPSFAGLLSKKKKRRRLFVTIFHRSSFVTRHLSLDQAGLVSSFALPLFTPTTVLTCLVFVSPVATFGGPVVIERVTTESKQRNC